MPHWENWTNWSPQRPNLTFSVGTDVPRWLTDFVSAQALFIGHNAFNFDAPFLLHHYGINPTWYDTVHGARASGLPGGLDALGLTLTGRGKNADGAAVMKLLCQAKMKDGEVTYPVGTLPLWSKLLDYNIQDVNLTEQVYHAVKGSEEPAVVFVDHRINERGVAVDTVWLKDLLRLWDELITTGGDRLSDLTDGILTSENVRSVPQVRKWLARQGLHLDSLNRKVLEPFYDYPEEHLGHLDHASRVVEVLKLRQSMTRAMKGKLVRILESLDGDSRVRDWSVYYGAHTGRFTSRRIQLHNMARGAPVDVEAIINGPRTLDHIHQHAKGCDVDDVLAALVRPMFCARIDSLLGICDYNAIEARGVAWLAGEESLLSAFRDPTRDVYCEFGSRIFGRPITKDDKTERAVAKICVLGMGYGMGREKFALYAKQSGIDLAALGLTAEGLVNQYRLAYPRIASMWKEVGDQALVGRRYGSGLCCNGRVAFRAHGPDNLYCVLPSGRILTYRSCRIEPRVPAYCADLGLPEFEKDTLVYRTPRGIDTTLHGAKLVENIVQAFCRDFLCDALVRMESRAYQTVLHVHDEVVCELKEDREIESMARLISTPPSWAPAFPLRVEGFTCPRYCKVPWRTSYRVDYMNGRSV